MSRGRGRSRALAGALAITFTTHLSLPRRRFSRETLSARALAALARARTTPIDRSVAARLSAGTPGRAPTPRSIEPGLRARRSRARSALEEERVFQPSSSCIRIRRHGADDGAEAAFAVDRRPGAHAREDPLRATAHGHLRRERAAARHHRGGPDARDRPRGRDREHELPVRRVHRASPRADPSAEREGGGDGVPVRLRGRRRERDGRALRAEHGDMRERGDGGRDVERSRVLRPESRAGELPPGRVHQG
eukprot:31080-Pelagococcus_subviridis.AAC.7